MTLQILDHESFTAEDVCLPVSEMPLETGDETFTGQLRARFHGRPEAPVIAVLGGISAGRKISGEAGWWPCIVGEGKAVDLCRFRVLGFDFIPDDATSCTYDFISTGDQANGLARIMDAAGIKRLQTIVGASYGGMVALRFAQLHPQRVDRLAIYGASHKAAQMSIARRSLQRRIIRLATRLGDTDAGLALARELAMTTYRSAGEFEHRFEPPYPGPDGEISAGVNDYLQARGAAFAGVMGAARFMTLSRSIDLHRADPAHINIPVSLLACRQDQIVPPGEMRELKDLLGERAALTCFDSD